MEANFRSQRQHSLEIIQEAHGSLVSSIKEKMANASFSYRICRASKKLHEDEEIYMPKVVSIGPLHRDKDNLKGTENQKWRYLNTLLNRKMNIDANLGLCVKVLKGSEQRARKCYAEEICMGSDEFVTMILLDGCFIIELFLRSSIKGLRRRDDPLFKTTEGISELKRDLILLENQVPFFAIQQLYDIVPIPKQCNYSLNELALRFFRKFFYFELQIIPEKLCQEVHHLLDLIYQCYLPTLPHVYSKGVLTIIPSATKLKKSGITFEKVKTESLLDIKFIDGVLEIPPMKIHDQVEILLRNIIAMEHCANDAPKYITSYVFLMKSLIQSEEDVKLLHRSRILDKGLGEVEETLALFKKINVEVRLKDFYYRGLCDQVNTYAKHKKILWCA